MKLKNIKSILLVIILIVQTNSTIFEDNDLCKKDPKKKNQFELQLIN